MRAWLRAYATKHPCHGFRRAWAALRYDERREVNKKKIHRLWREEGLQVRVHSPRKRAGVSSIPPVEADAPNVVWAIDFQFDSTIDGKAIKIASMIDEHTRESLLHMVERSITAERLVDELKTVFAAAGGPPKVLRMDNGPELVSQALQRFCEGKVGPVLYSAGNAVEQRLHRIVQQPTTQGVPQPQPLEHPVRGPRGHRRLQARAQPPTPPLGPGLPNAGRVRCGVQVHPHPGGLRDQLNLEPNNPTLNPGGLSNGDSPGHFGEWLSGAAHAVLGWWLTHAWRFVDLDDGGCESRIVVHTVARSHQRPYRGGRLSVVGERRTFPELACGKARAR